MGGGASGFSALASASPLAMGEHGSHYRDREDTHHRSSVLERSSRFTADWLLASRLSTEPFNSAIKTAVSIILLAGGDDISPTGHPLAGQRGWYRLPRLRFGLRWLRRKRFISAREQYRLLPSVGKKPPQGSQKFRRSCILITGHQTSGGSCQTQPDQGGNCSYELLGSHIREHGPFYHRLAYACSAMRKPPPTPASKHSSRPGSIAINSAAN